MKVDKQHRLLERQIKKYLPENFDRDELSDFLEAVEQAYSDYDRDLDKLENTLDQSSQELVKLNEQLRQRAEHKAAIARELSDRISAVVNNIQEIVFQTDALGRWTYLNPAFEKISGYTVEECLGQSFADIVYPGDKDLSRNRMQEMLENNRKSDQYNLRFLTKDYEIRWAEAFITLETDDKGRLTGASGLLNDITKRYEAEEKLKQTNLNLAEAQKIARLGSWEYRADNLWEGYWTDQMHQILEIKKDVTYNNPIEDLYRYCKKADGRKVEELVNHSLKTGQPGEMRYKIKPHRKEKWVLLKAKPIINEAGNVYKLVGTMLDISKQIEIEKELTQAKRTAEKALASKSEFLSNMSHEIRTPMNAIMGLTNLLIEEEDLSHDVRENLKLIGYSAENLLVLINDILDYSKIEANKIEFEQISFSLRDVLQKLLKTMRLKADEKGLLLNSQIDEAIPAQLVGDPYRLNQVLMNLLSNALKFTKEGKVEVEIRNWSSEDGKILLRIDVMDTGIGISKEKQQSIFESFTQANSETTRNYGGTGLGLAITKRLVELQGGSIEIESEPGQGSCFTVYMALKPAPASDKEAQRPASGQNHLPQLSGINMLVAEDNMVNQKLLKQICRQWNLEPQFVENGTEACDKCSQEAYDIILMDLQMPQMNGFDAVNYIVSHGESLNKNTPIIALTADAFQETKNRVFKSGFSAYVGKPYKADELRQAIVECIEKSQTTTARKG